MHDVHDHTFKTLMSHKRFLLAFFKYYLPEGVYDSVDWDSTSIFKLSGEHIREVFPFESTDKLKLKLTKVISDLTYLMNCKDKSKPPVMISIRVEHQSTPDKLLPLRSGLYNLAMLYEYAKMNKNKPLPHVYNIIYYHGRQSPYPYATNLYEMFDSGYNALGHLFQPEFIDLGAKSDEELLTHKEISSAEVTFKHIYDKDIDSSLPALIRGLQESDDVTLKYVLQYMYTVGESIDAVQLIKKLEAALPEQETKIMTIAEQLKIVAKQEGVQLGMQQGKREEAMLIARNMLNKGADINFIKEVTGLSLEELVKLNKRH